MSEEKKNIFLSEKKEILSAANFCHFLRLFIQFISFYYFFFKKLLDFTFAKKVDQLRTTLNFEYTLRQQISCYVFQLVVTNFDMAYSWDSLLFWNMEGTKLILTFSFSKGVSIKQKSWFNIHSEKSKRYDVPHF